MLDDTLIQYRIVTAVGADKHAQGPSAGTCCECDGTVHAGHHGGDRGAALGLAPKGASRSRAYAICRAD